MRKLSTSLLLAAAVSCVAAPYVAAFQTAPPVVKVCSLLPKPEVKKLIGGGELFDLIELQRKRWPAARPASTRE